MQKYDVIIPVAKKDIDFVFRVVDFLNRCLNGIDKIYILTASKNIKKLTKQMISLDNCQILDEDNLIDGLEFKRVKNLLDKYAPDKVWRTGWYFQQLLKFAFAKSIYSNKYYLSWDADTLPLAPIDFFKGENILFNPKSEYNPNYFKTIDKLLGFGKVADYSFISENMMFSTDIVREMLNEIEKSAVTGNDWVEKIFSASDFSTTFPAFSEFETYGTFCQVKYNGLYLQRHLNTFRYGNMICGKMISEKRLRLLSFDIDLVSFEKGHEPMFPYNFPQLRERFLRVLSMNPLELFKKIMIKIRHEDVDVKMDKMLYRLPPKKS